MREKVITMREKKWQIHEPIPIEVDTALADFNEGMRQLLYNRGIYTSEAAQEFLNMDGSTHDPFLMSGMDATVKRILLAIDNHEPIAVYGDYDVDGLTATTLMVEVLDVLGATSIGYIPNRFDEGYGLNEKALEKLYDQGYRVILTVDCGIRSIKEIERGNELGLEMIICDHHEPGKQIPPAHTVINPKQPGDSYPEKNLAGVGLAYKIAKALLTTRPVAKVNADEWLDLVALGTVADIVPLTGENRTLVKKGLEVLRTENRLGVRALANAAGVRLRNVTSRDIGFMIGPRLNAAGRLESAREAFDLLITTDEHKAASLAQKLDDLNKKRQRMIIEMQEHAKIIVHEKQGEPNILIACSPDFHKGIVGLIASRLCEEFYRPAIICNQGDEFSVGSCRSIHEFHITQALEKCADLFHRFGGHAMAAGFTIRTENLAALEDRLSKIANEALGDQELQPTIMVDMEIPLRQLPKDILERLALLEPAGQNNPEVVFMSRNVEVKDVRLVGHEIKKQHMSLLLTDGRKTYRAIAFRQGYWADQKPHTIDLIYSVKRNEFRGVVSTQLHVIDIKLSDQEL
ncbi:MAG: single-stranded-DNA-specific exonuclease RecJ [Anaerolineaceae bacterium]|nr:single-stranded-DNA-specific exonuclease RecJ [Anaerolineaceae bacterium]